MRPTLILAVAITAFLGFFSQAFASDSPPEVSFVGSIILPRENAKQGGFSGISLSEDGNSFTAISDKGTFFTGELHRNDKGFESVRINETVPMRDQNGKTLRGGRSDSEGLAIDQNGRLFVSFEGPARVWTFDGIDQNAEVLPRHPRFREMEVNGALEALAIDPEGNLYTLEEGHARDTEPHKVYRYRDGKWDIFSTISRRKGFLPVGADIGPDGKFYLLEREFSALSGFRSRVRQFEMTAQGLAKDTLLWESKFGRHGNLEGISVWRDEAGGIRFTMISDDNFMFFLRGEIVEYALTE